MDTQIFFSATLSAGAILSGFCGTFLSFRIQREATYFRQPVLDYKSGKAKDVPIGLSHFTSAFLLLIVASLFSMIFGVMFPILALAGVAWIAGHPALTIAGLFSTIIFVAGYFVCELVHYGILNRRLLNDAHEWGRSWGTVSITFLIALVVWILVLHYL